MTLSHNLPIIEHTRFLEELLEIPAYLHPENEVGVVSGGYFSCSFCGVGDRAVILTDHQVTSSRDAGFEPTSGLLTIERFGQVIQYPTLLNEDGVLEVEVLESIAKNNSVLHGLFEVEEEIYSIIAKESGVFKQSDGDRSIQKFTIYASTTHIAETHVSEKSPTSGCNKLKLAMGEQRSAVPIHIAPSVLDVTGRRVALYYEEALERLADLVLNHCDSNSRILIYASGQLDYFSVFAMQEVFRLLGVRNLGANSDYCLSAMATINEMQTGQESPFVTLEQANTSPNSFHIFSGWNGLISHPPVYQAFINNDDLDAYLIEVAVTESAKMLAAKLGSERVLLIKPGSDALLAMSIAHVILSEYSDDIEQRFIQQYSDEESFETFSQLVKSERYSPDNIAAEISADQDYIERTKLGIQDIARKLAESSVTPIIVPSVGMSQTKGVVPLGVWANVLAMLGKFGLKAKGQLAGGILRLPGQSNGQTLMQGFSSNHFFGRIPINEEGIKEVTHRLGLTDDAPYQSLLNQSPLSILDYSQSGEFENELILCFGTQPEKKMVNTALWTDKITSSKTTLVSIDPMPSNFALKHSALVIPPPPHAASSKLYQSGECRLTLSLPRRHTPEQTRSDATIVYDLMALISQRLRLDESLLEKYPQFKLLVESGYLQRRFESPDTDGELERYDGEVSRVQLWSRIQDYLDDGNERAGKLYCKPEDADGNTIEWSSLVESGNCLYGGLGETRYILDYDNAEYQPFSNIYGQPTKFQFFNPSESDMSLPEGYVLNTGRSTLSDNLKQIRFALSTFNSGKSTPVVNMPDENPLYISLAAAKELELIEGDKATIFNSETNQEMSVTIIPTRRVKGTSCYMSCHTSAAEMSNRHQLNALISSRACNYSGQGSIKLTSVEIKSVGQE